MLIKKTKIICSECNEEHEIAEAMYRSKIKRGQKDFYCSLSCAAKRGNKTHPNKLGKYKGNISQLKGYENNRLDEYSSFKYHLSRAKSRDKQKGNISNIDLKYLKEIWNKQNGICPYTGIKMQISRTSQDEDIKKTPIKASLDRIDPKIGYIKGNVEFVCYCVNVMKNDFTKDEMINFINQIKCI